MQRYAEPFKAQMVKRLLTTPGLSATQLSKEVDVAHSTLSRWVQESAIRGSMSNIPTKPSSLKASKSHPRRTQDWSAEERLKVVLEAARCSDAQLGEFLRVRGLHSATLEQWREDMVSIIKNMKTQKDQAKQYKKRISALEREVHRKDKALAETAALLVLKKKVQSIWGDEDDESASRNEP